MAGAERLELSTVGFGDRRSTIRTTPLYRMGYMIDESRFLVNTYFSCVPPPDMTVPVENILPCGKYPGVKFPPDFSTAGGGCACACLLQPVGFFCHDFGRYLCHRLRQAFPPPKTGSRGKVSGCCGILKMTFLQCQIRFSHRRTGGIPHAIFAGNFCEIHARGA